MNASEVLEQMEASGADLKIMILDACRNNPFDGHRRGVGRGLAVLSGGKGSLIAYATAPNRVADDNSGGSNGLYTTYLLQTLKEPNLNLETVFKRVSSLVQKASTDQQIPWYASSVSGDFYFHRSMITSSSMSRAPDEESWESTRDSSDPRSFDDSSHVSRPADTLLQRLFD